MRALVPFVCPKHGWICDTVASAQVYCARCKDWLPSQGRRSRSKFSGLEAAIRGRSPRAAKTASDQHPDTQMTG